MHEIRSDEVRYAGRVTSLECGGWWCTACDAVIFDGSELQKVEKAILDIRAECKQVLRPEQVAKLRTQLRLCRYDMDGARGAHKPKPGDGLRR